MKKVLIVDDERPFLLSLTDGLAVYADDFSVLTALNGKEAVKALGSTEVDLVVTDLKMPRMDGFELLAYMTGNFPNIPVIVMTAYGTPEIEHRLQDMGTLHYLEKPLDINVLADKIVDMLETDSSLDHIRGISLATFLQLVEMENKTCTLMIKSRGKEGYLYFLKGELIQAVTGEVKGEAAALDIVVWDNVAIEIKYVCNVKKKGIGLSLAEILMDGFRIKDEKEQFERERKLEKSLTDVGSPPIVSNGDDAFKKRKEITKMNVKKLNEAIDVLKEDLAGALLATDIWTVADGQSLAGFNPQPKAVALFNQVTANMMKSLKGSGFPVLGRYYILDLVDGKMVIVIPLEEYQWGMLIESSKAPLGLLLNVVIPQAIDKFEEARK